MLDPQLKLSDTEFIVTPLNKSHTKMTIMIINGIYENNGNWLVRGGKANYASVNICPA